LYVFSFGLCIENEFIDLRGPGSVVHEIFEVAFGLLN
jgi:hypothetical protein